MITSFTQLRRYAHWGRASTPPRLSDHELHIWRTSLALPPDQCDELRALLSDDEIVRANRFVFAHDRDRFIIARARLRRLLGAYLNLAPQQLRFAYTAYGKPLLADAAVAQGLTFNLSHSGDFALYAVSLNDRPGIDLEQLRQNLNFTLLLNDVCTPREQQRMAGMPPATARQIFFQTWVCKEAYLKARGEGLAYQLTHAEVLLCPNEPPSLTFADPAEDAQWHLSLLDPSPGYVAAVVTTKATATMRMFDCP
ncbi:4'-phosphopantetheinyl transferase superfamily protein [Candidatus Chloroploca sp. Khr17]|uniref:4'-phosphopantetheinyl transferase family protein n=1 Tax=Candidatus Chloroploca sp. Khr17 TaxID=2496869 RepID=UPI00101BD53E|nr:4'-phosphopantetheinyl transferase superfamily protein [Candidatus Chloroploca sp. Khr17]